MAPQLKRTVSYLPTATLKTFHGSSSDPITDDDTNLIVFERHSEHAIIPTRATLRSAGSDLYAAESVTIGAWKNYAVSTGISITSFPKHCYGRIAGRSGLAFGFGIFVGAGVIDRDYTGIVKVVLFNFSDYPFTVSIGDRIAQLVCEVYVHPTIDNSLITVPLNDTTQQPRGESGFGSTGR